MRTSYLITFICGLLLLVADVSVADFSDDFEDGVIDTSMWAFGGQKRSYLQMPAGSWDWSREEITNTDGYLQVRVYGPTSGVTYGHDAWIRTKHDFNDGKSYLVNFTWEAEVVGEGWVDFYFIQITDGYTPANANYNWPIVNPPAGTTDLLWHDSGGNPVNCWTLLDGMAKTSMSIKITPDGTAKLYDGPNGSGNLLHQGSLNPNVEWYIRFMVSDATSAGFPAGDSRLNLYDFSAVSESVGTMLSGVVFEDKNENESYNSGEEISGAQVSTQGISDTTGSDGRYLLEGLSSGATQLEVRIGGKLYGVKPIDVEEGENNYNIAVQATVMTEAYQCADADTVCALAGASLMPWIGVPSLVQSVKNGICEVRRLAEAGDSDGAYSEGVATGINALFGAAGNALPGVFVPINVVLAAITCYEAQLEEINKDGIIDPSEWLKLGGEMDEFTAMYTASPVDIRILNSHGDVMELNSEGLTENQLGYPAWIFKQSDQKRLALILDAEGSYSVVITGTPDAGSSATFVLQMMRQGADGSQEMYTFTNVPISAQGVAVAQVGEEINPVLEVDVDGDGTVDLNTLSDSLAMEVTPRLPSSGKNKAGRTMPVKFSLRRPERVDPAMLFVYDEDLEIRIYDSVDPDTILQTSRHGDTARDYRIDTADELYTTNFRTMKEPAEYVVEIWRTDLPFKIGKFTFETVK